MVTISILTLFPDVFIPLVNSSIIKNAQEKHLVEIRVIDIRNFTKDARKTVDDRPFGGGVGMVMKVDILDDAIAATRIPTSKNEKVYLLDPKGQRFNQKIARELSSDVDHLILLCGHYEGVDARITHFIDGMISIGDFVVTGGEIPAMLVMDAVTRLIPGVLEDDATRKESFENHILEYEQFTRPAEYKGHVVPDVLVSGNHQAIEEWRKESGKSETTKHRPDLLEE